ncbi:Coenzyme F390 synthetase [Methanonatronarchaeum thermophilum]|uniref:Coenzyme F390 synthetase n=1 Tax=Methanonatronarchaeum thermophilum TaxID=1927129 RepID=A0A1Y3GD26_9EURY|nr:AMP-binding protein [Methanonatronarchaeum thermophilum]OUJ18223.1 Coenzyme F390 synthetase [Methanonatronarchaeum thermophilum]
MDLEIFVKNNVFSWFEDRAGEEVVRSSSLSSIDDVGRAEISRYSEHLVLENLRYAFENSSYYRDLFKEKDVVVGEIDSLDVFREEVPLTSVEEVVGNHYRFMAVTRNDIFRGFTDSGKRILYTKEELKNLVKSISAGLETVGLDRDDRLLITFPKETEWGCPFLVKMAAVECDCTVMHTDHLTADEQVEKMGEFEPTAVIGSHPYLYTLAKTVDRMDIGLSGVDIDKMIMSRGCVYYPFNEDIRNEIERIYRCDVYDHYGTTETGFAVAIECQDKDGLHVNESEFYLEVVDPETLEPLGSGEEGELVVTTLSREGMPLIRYRTGDITSIDNSIHSCGSILSRLNGIKGEVGNKYPGGSGLPLF